MRQSIRNSLYFLIGLLGFKSLPAAAATQMFLCSTDTELEGEATDDNHKGCIDVLAWSWGASSSGTTHTGAGGEPGRVGFNDLSVTKWVDKASPNLMKLIANGDHIQEVELLNLKQSCCDKLPFEFYTIKMVNVIVTSVAVGGSAGEDRLTENISLNFSKFQYCYTEQSGDDGSPGALECFEWDIATSAPP